MDPILIFFASSIWVLVLYLLNKVFNYKGKLIKYLGIVKYKVILFVMFLLAYLILILEFNVKIYESPIGLLIFWSYIYLVQNPKHYR